MQEKLEKSSLLKHRRGLLIAIKLFYDSLDNFSLHVFVKVLLLENSKKPNFMFF